MTLIITSLYSIYIQTFYNTMASVQSTINTLLYLDITILNLPLQIPHKHFRTAPETFGEKVLSDVHNYCRNPVLGNLKGKSPYCYTTDPTVRTEFCSVPECGEYIKKLVSIFHLT